MKGYLNQGVSELELKTTFLYSRELEKDSEQLKREKETTGSFRKFVKYVFKKTLYIDLIMYINDRHKAYQGKFQTCQEEYKKQGI